MVVIQRMRQQFYITHLDDILDINAMIVISIKVSILSVWFW